MAAARSYRSPDRGQRDPGRRAAQARHVRAAADQPADAARCDDHARSVHGDAGHRGDRVRGPDRVGPGGHQEARRLFIGFAPRVLCVGDVLADRGRAARIAALHDQSRTLDCGPVPCRGVHLRTLPHTIDPPDRRVGPTDARDGLLSDLLYVSEHRFARVERFRQRVCGAVGHVHLRQAGRSARMVVRGVRSPGHYSVGRLHAVDVPACSVRAGPRAGRHAGPNHRPVRRSHAARSRHPDPARGFVPGPGSVSQPRAQHDGPGPGP